MLKLIRSLLPVVLTAAVLAACHKNTSESGALSPALRAYLKQAESEMTAIPAERAEAIRRIAVAVADKVNSDEAAQLVYICTHNSRRSHMSQAFAIAAAQYYGVEGTAAYSGGTEATAFNPRAIRALQEAGFDIQAPADAGENPVYTLRPGPQAEAHTFFSKKFADASNPQSGFIAVLTCSEADKTCPIVPGASLRVSLPYEDPKAMDNTPAEAEAYRTRARQIAAEELLLFKTVSELL